MILRVVLLAAALPLLSADPAVPTFRLPNTAAPIRCALNLTVIPEKETFSGVIDIDTSVLHPTDVLWLNAKGLNILEASYTPVKAKAVSAKVRYEGKDFLGLAFNHPLHVGTGRIHIRYEAPLSRRENSGLFTQQKDGNWYACTQFEDTDARRAFPCFDEPAFKIPWNITLHVREGDQALSNWPVAAEIPEGNGMKTIRFAPTRPLPSYLVAFAVGPFEMVDLGKVGMKGTPLRIIVPKGHLAEADYMAKAMPELFTRLEQYFGIPFPYPKLDSLAVPRQMGAMENAGLIINQEGFLLAGPASQTTWFKHAASEIAAHEMAHQWFGDLVTMAWWDDTWLNESFASWMAARILRDWKPEWELDATRMRIRKIALEADSHLSARQIHQPVTTEDDIKDAFDEITYQKGETVLNMFESYLGPERFRQGIRRHLRQHADGNATMQEFLAALAAKRSPRIARVFGTFLDQPGVPQVTVELQTGPSGNLLHFAQRRYLPIGSKATGTKLWTIPLDFRYTLHGKVVQRRVLMKTTELNVKVGGAPGDLGTVVLNQNALGYYIAIPKGDLLPHTLVGEAGLPLAEKLNLIMDVDAAVQAGECPADQDLALVLRFARDPNSHVLQAVASLATQMGNDLVPHENRPAFARLIQACFGERARALGFAPKAGESDGDRFLRQILLTLVGLQGEDATLRAQAKELTLRWLDDRSVLDPDLVNPVLTLAAGKGDRSLFDRLLKEAKAEKQSSIRHLMLRALGLFQNPEIVKIALAGVLDQDLNANEAMTILQAASSTPGTRQMAYDFMKENWETILGRLPAGSAGMFTYLATGFDDATHYADVEAFFRDRIAGSPGAPRELAITLETIRMREARKAALQPGVIAFIERY